jgi:hypothetical protein
MMKKRYWIILLVSISIIGLVMIIPFVFKGSPYRSCFLYVGSKTNRSDSHSVLIVDHHTIESLKYVNRDDEGDHYSIIVPRGWSIRSKGPESGGYVISSDEVKGMVELFSIPEDLTLLDYIVTVERPKIVPPSPELSEAEFVLIPIDGLTAYQWTYTGIRGDIVYRTVRTYIPGPQKSCVITFICKFKNIDTVTPLINRVVMSFAWEK